MTADEHRAKAAELRKSVSFVQDAYAGKRAVPVDMAVKLASEMAQAVSHDCTADLLDAIYDSQDDVIRSIPT